MVKKFTSIACWTTPGLSSFSMNKHRKCYQSLINPKQTQISQKPSLDRIALSRKMKSKILCGNYEKSFLEWFQELVNNDARLILRESLTGQRHDRVPTESQIATVDSCFDLVGSLQHGVASCEVFSWSTDIHKPAICRW